VEGLELELRALIQQACDLDDAKMATLTDDDPLVGPESPLGLDSLDALEIVTAVQRQYAVRIDNQNTSIRVLQSIRILADFIRQEKASAPPERAGAGDGFPKETLAGDEADSGAST